MANGEVGDVCSFEYGVGLPKKERKKGKYPVMGSNGKCGFHNDFLIKGPAIIIGRKGSAGKVIWEKENCFPIDTTYYIKLLDVKNVILKYLYHILCNVGLENLKEGAGIPGLNRNDAYAKKIPLSPLEVQKEIVKEIENCQEIINGVRVLIDKQRQKIYEKISEIWEQKE